MTENLNPICSASLNIFVSLKKTKELTIRASVFTEKNRKEIILRWANLMATKEHTLQFQIVEFLRLKGFIVIDCDIMDGLKFCSGHMRFAFINYHKKMGYVKGQPDLIVLKNGKFWLLELKSEKGKQSIEQIEYQKLCEVNGIDYIVIRNLEDLKQLESK